jgi:hypothetical protein
MQEVAHQPILARPVVSTVGAVVATHAAWVSGRVPAESAEAHDAVYGSSGSIDVATMRFRSVGIVPTTTT